jgi:aquaporin Z
MMGALQRRWPAYLTEAAGLIVFMLGAGLFTTAFMHPGSPLHAAAGSPLARRAAIGACMALVTVAIIYGAKRSGAHINPAVTLALLIRKRISRADAVWYVIFQFAGALLAPYLVLALIGDAFRHPEVKLATSAPGPAGPAAAFAAEFAITFVLMLAVLVCLDSRRLREWLGVIVAVLIGVYITVESPLSGMSMNPARSFGSAVAAAHWDGLWIYFVAPPLAAVAAVVLYDALRRSGRVGPGPRSWIKDFEEGPQHPLAKPSGEHPND